MPVPNSTIFNTLQVHRNSSRSSPSYTRIPTRFDSLLVVIGRQNDLLKINKQRCSSDLEKRNLILINVAKSLPQRLLSTLALIINELGFSMRSKPLERADYRLCSSPTFLRNPVSFPSISISDGLDSAYCSSSYGNFHVGTFLNASLMIRYALSSHILTIPQNAHCNLFHAAHQGAQHLQMRIAIIL